MFGVLCVLAPGEELMLQWCVDNWDILLKVCRSEICTQLLKTLYFIFLATGVLAFSNAQFGAGVGPIQLESVACNGNERNLIDCPHTSFISCNYYSGGTGVRCQGW